MIKTYSQVRVITSYSIHYTKLYENVAVRKHGLHHLRPDGQHRVQGHHGVLEDHADAVAPHLAHLFLGKGRKVAPVKPDRAVGNEAGLGNKSYNFV